MKKSEFWGKLILWLIFAAVIPVVTIIDKYDMVKNGTIKYTGWAILVIAIITIVLMVMLGYVLKAMKWSMFKQIVSGIRNVLIPLAVLLVCAELIATNIANIKYILIVSIISESFAILVNPFPKWLYLKNISDLREALK